MFQRYNILSYLHFSSGFPLFSPFNLFMLIICFPAAEGAAFIISLMCMIHTHYLLLKKQSRSQFTERARKQSSLRDGKEEREEKTETHYLIKIL